MRATHRWRTPGGQWCFDTWGQHGRPVILLPAVLFDRSSWWPVAADLRPHATVMAVDLPGHGGSTARASYRPDDLVDDLAALVAQLGLRQAPVLVGHGSCAALTARFATRYATHAVVAVDPQLRVSASRDQYLRELGSQAVPEPYRDLAIPAGDPHLLAAYRDCVAAWPPTGTPSATRHARLAIHSRPPRPGDVCALPGWRHETYGLPGPFPQLSAVDRIVRDLRALL
jgi:pimeloyl-ACP methyl ester carboxylesterase